MSKRIGRYSVEARTTTRADGRFLATAHLVWDDADATNEQQIHFFKAFDTAEAAEAHAFGQVEARVRDGAL